ncbi:Mismatch repair endonuclease PMS2 [Geodia barretti]|nr:Mismatch repair endonuclease PMS2 [Geodia barretti]
MFERMHVIGQFNLGFIITRLDTDIFIIDQHATDEKYNYERLQREAVIDHQKLIQPKLLELTAVSENIILDNLEMFRMNGFHFHIDHNAPTQRLRLTSQPVYRGVKLGTDEIDEMVFLLSDNPGEMVRPSKLSQMFASKACRGSVMIGKALSRTEMKKLVVHIGLQNQPWNCPHGRPTFRHLVDLSLL